MSQSYIERELKFDVDATFVLPELRVVQASPRLMLVRVAELERWATRREAIADLD